MLLCGKCCIFILFKTAKYEQNPLLFTSTKLHIFSVLPNILTRILISNLIKFCFFHLLRAFTAYYCLRQQTAGISRTCGKVKTNRTVFILCVAMTWLPFLFVLHGNFACFALQFRPICSPILPKLLSVFPWNGMLVDMKHRRAAGATRRCHCIITIIVVYSYRQ